MIQLMGPVTANDNDGAIITEQSTIRVYCPSIRSVYLLYQVGYCGSTDGRVLLIRGE
jgi:hypothetical protein